MKYILFFIFSVCAVLLFPIRPAYALTAGNVTATLSPSSSSVAVGSAVTVTLRLSAPEDIPLRGAQFSLLTPQHVVISNIRSHINLGTNDAFAALAAQEGSTTPFDPLQIAVYTQKENTVDVMYNEAQITFLTVGPEILPTGAGPVDVVSFDVTPTQEGQFKIWFRDSSFTHPFQHTVTDNTTNYLHTASLSAITLSTSDGSITGDTDNDNDVDIFDYNVVLSYFGQQVSGVENGDLDGDGDVDIFDYNLIISHFGQRASPV